MLGRSSLPEREMGNKFGVSSSGNLRHFYKALCFFSSPSKTWGKNRWWFLLPPLFNLPCLVFCIFNNPQLMFLLFRKILCIDTRRGAILHCLRNPNLRHARTTVPCKKCLVLHWVKVKQYYSKRHSFFGQEIVEEISNVLPNCPEV